MGITCFRPLLDPRHCRQSWLVLALVLVLVAVTVFPAGCGSPGSSTASVEPRPASNSTANSAAAADSPPTEPPDPEDVAPENAVPENAAPESITWQRLDIGMEPDSVYQPWMLTHSIKVLEGKPVRIKGYMHGAVFQRSNIRTFHLMREQECPFGPGGQAHHAIEVELQGPLRTKFRTDEVTLEGIFRVAPVQGENGNTWSLYRLEGTSIQ